MIRIPDNSYGAPCPNCGARPDIDCGHRKVDPTYSQPPEYPEDEVDNFITRSYFGNRGRKLAPPPPRMTPEEQAIERAIQAAL